MTDINDTAGQVVQACYDILKDGTASFDEERLRAILAPDLAFEGPIAGHVVGAELGSLPLCSAQQDSATCPLGALDTPAKAQLARRYWPMARRMASETLMCSSAARTSKSRFSSGSSLTDSTEEAAEPIGGRPPRRRCRISSTS